MTSSRVYFLYYNTIRVHFNNWIRRHIYHFILIYRLCDPITLVTCLSHHHFVLVQCCLHKYFFVLLIKTTVMLLNLNTIIRIFGFFLNLQNRLCLFSWCWQLLWSRRLTRRFLLLFNWSLGMRRCFRFKQWSSFKFKLFVEWSHIVIWLNGLISVKFILNWVRCRPYSHQQLHFIEMWCVWNLTHIHW